MRFVKIDLIENNEYKSEKFENNLLLKKQSVKQEDIIFLDENQSAILFEKGKIKDFIKDKGCYKIINEKNENLDKIWEECYVKKAEKEELCIIFLNNKVIENNKYYIRKPIEYIDWSYKEEPLAIKLKCQGKFNFQIIDYSKFLEKLVIGLRANYSKQELIEQIRNYITNSITKGIKEISSEYKLNIKEICEKSKESEIKLSQNIYDEKLLEKGVKITYFDIEKLEVDDKISYEINEEEMNKIKICENCGFVIEKDELFCKQCGTLNN